MYKTPRLISLTHSTVWQVEKVYTGLPDTALQMHRELEEDLYELQKLFKEIVFFKHRPYALGEVNFYPPLMADRIILEIQEHIKHAPATLGQYNLRVELVVTLDENLYGESHVSVSLWKPSDIPDGYKPGKTMPDYMTPCYSTGLGKIRNAHKVANAYSLVFPMTAPPMVNFINGFAPDNVSHFSRELFTQKEIIDYYLSWADNVAQVILKSQYLNWVKVNPLPVVMTGEQLDARWLETRARIEQHLNENMARYIKQENRSLNLLAMMIHPPDNENLQKDPGLVLEFILVEYNPKISGNIAKTIELTGRILQPSDFIPVSDESEHPIVH